MGFRFLLYNFKCSTYICTISTLLDCLFRLVSAIVLTYVIILTLCVNFQSNFIGLVFLSPVQASLLIPIYLGFIHINQNLFIFICIWLFSAQVPYIPTYHHNTVCFQLLIFSKHDFSYPQLPISF